MDYQTIYNRIIERNRNTPKVKKQTEDHHIIPRSFAKIDGIDDIDGSWNRVNLPLREHFIAHLLLARIWRGHKIKGPKMTRAFSYMSNNGKYTSKDYKWLNLNYNHSEETKQKIGNSNKGKLLGSLLDNERKQKIKNTLKDRKFTSEHRAKISKSLKGRLFSEEHKNNLSESHKGKPRKEHSEETKQKMKEAAKNRKPVSEETKQKMKKAAKNRKPMSEETKKKLSEIHTGKKKSESHKQAIKNSWEKRKSKSERP